MICNIDTATAMILLNTAKPTNAKYKRSQFDKYLDFEFIQPHTKIAYLNDDNNLNALAIVDLNSYVTNELKTTFIKGIQSIHSGHDYGRKLLDYIISEYDNVWLLADPSANDALKEYYRSFDSLNEFSIDTKRYSEYTQNISFFISKNMSENDVTILHNYILQTFVGN